MPQSLETIASCDDRRSNLPDPSIRAYLTSFFRFWMATFLSKYSNGPPILRRAVDRSIFMSEKLDLIVKQLKSQVVPVIGKA